MKKIISMAIILCMITVLSFSSVCFAATDVTAQAKIVPCGAVSVTNASGSTYTIGSDELTVKYNGEAVTFPDAQPFVDANGRTLIPVRAVTETMGADVDWKQETLTAIITQNGITVNVTVGSDTISITKDGTTSTVQMNTTAILKGDRTYVPIRYIAEGLDAWVGYSDLFTTVQIYRDKLTPDEITRLHGYYDMTWEEYCASSGEPIYGVTDAVKVALYPQIAYFTGTNGFANANEWKLRNPNQPETYTGKTTGKTFTCGSQPEVEFVKLAISEAQAAQEYYNATGKVTLSLKTDLSCVFWSLHSSGSHALVRGVLTVTLPKNADIDWIMSNCAFIANPKAGETREIDVEIAVMTYAGIVSWRVIEGIVALH